MEGDNLENLLLRWIDSVYRRIDPQTIILAISVLRDQAYTGMSLEDVLEDYKDTVNRSTRHITLLQSRMAGRQLGPNVLHTIRLLELRVNAIQQIYGCKGQADNTGYVQAVLHITRQFIIFTLDLLSEFAETPRNSPRFVTCQPRGGRVRRALQSYY